MQFIQVGKVFEQIEQVASRLQITRLLANLFDKASPREVAIICNLSLGQLHPPYIGTQFNIADKSIIKILAQFLTLSEAQIKQELKKVSDLGMLLEQYEWPVKKSLTVIQVYDALCAIEKISGIGSQEKKNKELRILLESLDSLSAKYVVRVVLGKTRLGFSDMTLIDALSWMEVGDKSLRAVIESAYNICSDIGLVASTLKEKGVGAIEKMHIKVGIPIRPAMAERLPTAKAIIEKIGPCVAQPKFDGFRLQIHMDKTGKIQFIRFFSRHLQDMSSMFPDLKKHYWQYPLKILFAKERLLDMIQMKIFFYLFKKQ